jgi:hypothetical protein
MEKDFKTTELIYVFGKDFPSDEQIEDIAKKLEVTQLQLNEMQEVINYWQKLQKLRTEMSN